MAKAGYPSKMLKEGALSLEKQAMMNKII